MILNDRFRIIKEIGTGGMGEVHLAEDLKLKRKVAIKRISENAIEDTNTKARFLREAQTASSLDHTNICTIYEIYNEPKEEYIVMQYIDGITIDQIISIKKLSINKIIDVAMQICDGMIEAHQKGVIHRDIKPSNIIIDKKGIVKILDFGLAKFNNEIGFSSMQSTNITEQGIVLGTVSYMSPEQARGENLDKTSDIFSFGTVFFEMLEGYNPFLADQKIETLYNVISLDIKFKRNIPEILKRVIEKVLEKNKNNRYLCFEDIKKDLLVVRDTTNKKSKINEDNFNENSLETELINIEDSIVVRSGTNTSDNEGLADMVNRIGKYKGSTESISSGNLIKSGKRKYIILIMIFLAIIVAFIIKNNNSNNIDIKQNQGLKTQKKQIYIKLNLFEDLSENKRNLLSEKINYLLIEFLNQSNGIRTVSELVIEGIKQDGNFNESIKDIKYELKGRVSSKNDIYTIDAELISIENREIKKRFTKTGIGKNSILLNQIDSLSNELLKFLLQKEKRKEVISLKKVSKVYGKEWDKFEAFYNGLLFYKKLDIEKSIKIFEKINENPVAKYYLANLYYFNGNKKKALKTINKVVPQIGDLTESFRDRVLAFKAQLDYDFKKQIKYLKNLKRKFPFSKEIFFEIGEAYFHHGEASNAIDNYKKALFIDKNYSQAINHLGYCYSYMGEHEKALDQFHLYRTRDDLSANSLDSLGDGYFYKGDFEDSLAMKISAVELSPNGVTWAYLTIYDILVIQAKYKQAIEILNRYRTTLSTKNMLKERDQAVILTKNAYILYLEKDYNGSRLLVQKSISLFDSSDIIDNFYETHWLSGLISIKTGDIINAKKELNWLRKIIIKYNISEDNYYEPYKFYLHLNSLVLEKNGNLKEAENCHRKLIEMKTQLSYWITYYNYQYFYNEYIKFLNRSKRYEKALNEAEICLSFSDKYIPTLWQKAIALEKTGKSNTKSIYQKIEELYNSGSNSITEKNLKRETLSLKLKEQKDDL